MKDRSLPTIARIVAELDGSYIGTTLYGIVKDMDWGRHGHRLGHEHSESITFHSPLYNKLHGRFSVSYYDGYPKKCLPTRSELEVEMYSDDSTSLLVASVFERNRDGVEVSLYHRNDRRSCFQIFGPTRLFGGYAGELKKYQENPMGSLPSPITRRAT